MNSHLVYFFPATNRAYKGRNGGINYDAPVPNFHEDDYRELKAKSNDTVKVYEPKKQAE